MRMDIVIPILNQHESARKTLESLLCTEDDLNTYILIDNGSNPPLSEYFSTLSNIHIIRNEHNVGLPHAYNQAREFSTADYLFYTHSDIEMFEQGWDTKIKKILGALGSVGVAGFFGASGIGTPDIYRSPYRMQQLVRVGTMAGDRCRLDPQVHGHRQFAEEFQRCAVLDGFSLIARHSLEFWNESVHHNYDNNLCLDSLDQGYQNIVINMDVIHYGGRTDVGEDWATAFGKTKAEIHAESHLPLYEKWRPGNHNISLPFYL